MCIRDRNRGEGYTTPPTVAFSAGTGAGDAVLATGGRVEGFEIQTGGSGFSNSPTIAIDAPPQLAFVASSTTVDTTANTISITSHPFETGDTITYDTTTLDSNAVAIGGISAGTYYAIRVDDDTIKVASSASNANAGTALSLTSIGSGSQFFTGVQAVAGAVTVTAGEITAIAVSNKGSGYLSLIHI